MLVISERCFSHLKASKCGEITLRNGVQQTVSRYRVLIAKAVKESRDGNHYISLDVKNFNHFDIRAGKDCNITAWPVNKGDPPVNEQGKWIKQGRQVVRAKILFSIFEPALDYYHACDTGFNEPIEDPDLIKKLFNKMMENFICALKEYSIEAVEEHLTPSEVFAMEHEGFSSCMASSYPDEEEDCAGFGYLYDLIGCRMTIVQKEDYLYGRALLWDVKDGDGNSYTFQDRPYGTETAKNQMIEYAKEMGYLWRKSDCNDILNHKGETMKVYVCVGDDALNCMLHDGLPYIDTLHYFDGIDKLSNWSGESIQSQEGLSVNGRVCDCCGEICGDRIETPGGRYEMYCEECFQDHYFYCTDCGEPTAHDCSVYVPDQGEYCEYCASTLFSLCVECDERVSNDDIVIQKGYNFCVTCFNNLYTECWKCSDVISFEDASVIDGKLYCNDCFIKIKKEVQYECGQ